MKKRSGVPAKGLLTLNANVAEDYKSLSATAETISTSSAKGTATFTLRVKPSRFSCANISAEISETFLLAITFSQFKTPAQLLVAVGPLPFLRGRYGHTHSLSVFALKYEIKAKSIPARNSDKATAYYAFRRDGAGKRAFQMPPILSGMRILLGGVGISLGVRRELFRKNRGRGI